MASYRRNLLLGIAAVAIVPCAGCRRAEPPIVPNIVVVRGAVPGDPGDPAWNQAPEHTAKLIPQDLVEPRLTTPSTGSVRVRAISNGERLAFRLEWDDDSRNDTTGPAQFPDACAVQLPAATEPTVPAPQMGEPGRPVEIAYWNAAWQATVDGRGASLNDLYPRAVVDHYPFEAKSLEKDPTAQREMATRYAPAKALGNLMSGPRASPVEDLVADGPSTLRRATSGTSTGHGERTASGWAVVLSRPLPAEVSATVPTQVALAVWRGDQQEVGARKMRTGWIPLTIEEQP